jgi:hypothetical protein
MSERRAEEGKATIVQATDTAAPKAGNVFQNEFENEKKDSSLVPPAGYQPANTTLQESKLYNYKFKFSNDYVISGFSNNVLINRYQPYGGGSGPIQLGTGSNLNFTFRASVSDLMEDIKFLGGFRLGTNLRDNDYLLGFQNVRKRLDWGLTYYRTSDHNYGTLDGLYNVQLNTALYQGNVSYPLNEIKSLRATMGYRRDTYITKAFNNGQNAPDRPGLSAPNKVTQYALGRLEYVHDNTLNPAQNIWHGLRYKVFFDINMPVTDPVNKGAHVYNLGFDARHYVPIYRNFIWATRAAGDFSFGEQKIIYYLGGTDGWLRPKFNDANRPSTTERYAFQSLAVNLRGFPQNTAHGNNAFVFNSEFRLPVFSTLVNKPINNAFLRNLQLVQFTDLGTAWRGLFKDWQRPSVVYSSNSANNPVQLRVKAGGIGPLAGSYGFGVRSTILGYFLKYDLGWEMNGVFKGKPYGHISMGLDF